MEPENTDKPLQGPIGPQKTLRTYQSDLAEAIKDQQGSVIKIAMAEQERNQKIADNANPVSKKNLTYLFISGILIFIALGVVIYFVITSKPKTVSIEEHTALAPTLIHTDSIKTLDVAKLTREQIADAIVKEYTSATPTLNTIEQILFTNTDIEPPAFITTSTLWSLLGSHIEPTLDRSLESTFTLGIHAWNKNGLFILMKTNSYPIAFAGMLKWETSLFDDLYRMFGISVAGENNGLFNTKWKDKVIQNQDTRILTGINGETILFYTFLGENKDLILIADHEHTLTEILNRMTANTIRQ